MQHSNRNVFNANQSSIMNTSAHETSILNYNGNTIHFEFSKGEVMVNLTQMAKAFGKRPNDFLSLSSTTLLIEAITRKNGISENQIVIQKKGSSIYGGGTWGNRLIALSFAQWLSVDFHLICLEKIEELLTYGVTTINNEDETIINAINILQKRLDSKSQQVQILEGENQVYREEITKLEPKARYTDEVLQSTSTFTATQMSDHFRISTIKFNNILKEKGIQYSQSGQWHLTAKYKNLSLTEVRVGKYVKGDEIGTNNYMVWTEKGRKFLVELFKSAE